MLIKKLLVPFINEKILYNAEHCYIATASLSEPALDFLMSKLPPKCKVDVLTGLDFPTSPGVLQKVLKQYPTRIHLRIHTKGTFHSNAFIFDLPFRKMVAFVGSASLTIGGLKDHEELSYKIDNEKAVEELKSWFRTHFEPADALTERFINQYQDIFPSLRNREIESNREKKEVLEAITGSFRWNTPLASQYVQEEDYKAFEGHKLALNTPLIQFERERVQTKLLELHEQLLPFIKTLKLYPFADSTKMVSSLDPLYHPEHKVKGIWLSYGRVEKELKEYHAQLEEMTHVRIVISRNGIGILLLPGKHHASNKDLDFFRSEMQKEDYRKKFFDLLKSLGEDYWIDIAGEKRSLSFFKSAEHIMECLLQESIDFHFIIGKNYVPNHPDVSEAKLLTTLQGELTKLNTVYRWVLEK